MNLNIWDDLKNDFSKGVNWAKDETKKVEHVFSVAG